METLEKTELSALELPDGTDEHSLTVCFVCTGNTCRSPMAEAYMKSLGYKNTFSRGLHAFERSHMSPLAQRTLREEGIEVPEHEAHNITEADIAVADAVYAMTSKHATELFYAFPQFASKIRVMPREIPDPFGGDLDVYKKTFAEIKSAVAEIIGSNEQQ